MKVLISLILSGLMGLNSTVEAQNNGQLVVFVQEGRSISQDFKRHALPEVKKIAKQNGLQLMVVDASNGAPKEVTYTPSIFMVKGNSNVLYNGRYNKFDDLTAFVQSGGKKQPSTIEKNKDASLAWNIERATIKTTIRINPLTGKPPRAKKFDADQFEAEANAALVNGMEYFRSAAASQMVHESKAFHIEFFPKVNTKEGVLLIQMELYSEFDSQTPIFKTTIPSGSDWKEWQKAFNKAGNRIEKAVIAQISNWDNGDGFDTLKSSLPTRSWTEALSYQNEEQEQPQMNEKGLGLLLASDRE